MLGSLLDPWVVEAESITGLVTEFSGIVMGEGAWCEESFRRGGVEMYRVPGNLVDVIDKGSGCDQAEEIPRDRAAFVQIPWREIPNSYLSIHSPPMPQLWNSSAPVAQFLLSAEMVPSVRRSGVPYRSNSSIPGLADVSIASGVAL